MTATTTVLPKIDRAASDIRMLQVLLSSCDPCGAAAATGDTYEQLAGQILKGLEAGDDAVAIMLSLPGTADAATAWRFARVAVDWWHRRTVFARG